MFFQSGNNIGLIDSCLKRMPLFWHTIGYGSRAE